MDSEMIGIIASDMRQIYMSEMLKKRDTRCTSWI